MVSFKESAPLLTKESATAPLKALATLAMRMRSSILKGSPLFMLRTPKVCTLLLAALHDGDDARLPVIHGDEILERSIECGISAFGLLLAQGRALLPARSGTEATAVAKAVCFRKRLLLMFDALPSDRCVRSSVAIPGFPLLVGFGGVALPRSAYHDAIQGSFAFAHPFRRYTTAQLQLPSRRVLMPERCHQCPCGVLPAAPDRSLAPLNFREFTFHALR